MLRYPYVITVTADEEYVATFEDFEGLAVLGHSIDQLKYRLPDLLVERCALMARENKHIPLPSPIPEGAHFVMLDMITVLKIHLNNLLVEHGMSITTLAKRASMTTSADMTVMAAADFHHKSTATSMCFALAQFGVYPEITLKSMA